MSNTGGHNIIRIHQASTSAHSRGKVSFSSGWLSTAASVRVTEVFLVNWRSIKSQQRSFNKITQLKYEPLLKQSMHRLPQVSGTHWYTMKKTDKSTSTYDGLYSSDEQTITLLSDVEVSFRVCKCIVTSMSGAVTGVSNLILLFGFRFS